MKHEKDFGDKRVQSGRALWTDAWNMVPGLYLSLGYTYLQLWIDTLVAGWLLALVQLYSCGGVIYQLANLLPG